MNEIRIPGVSVPIRSIPSNPGNYGGYRPLSAIRYLVIHYTANKWDSAESNGRYFQNNVVKASANYFVDSDSIVCSVPDEIYAWHCGGGLQGPEGHSFYKRCNNYNSIGIEICDDVNDGKIRPTEKTLENAQQLTAALMKKYDVPIENVIRHWDVTGKLCPAYFVGDEKTETGRAWLDWKDELEVMGMKRYKTVAEVPESIRSEIKEMVDLGIIRGNGDKGLDMTYDMLRSAVYTLRAIKQFTVK